MEKKSILNFLGGISCLFASVTSVYADPSTNSMFLQMDSDFSEFELNKQKNKAVLDSNIDTKDLKNIEYFGFVDMSDDEINKEIDKISQEAKYATKIADTNNNVVVRNRNHNNIANVVKKNHNTSAAKKANNFDNSYLSLLAKYRDLTQEVILQGLKFIGVKYRFGGTNEKYGLDCSGYVQLVFKNSIGLLLPRTAAEMSNVGETVKQNELKPGDLVFFNTMQRDFSHVGIYLGDNYFMHAPSTGAEVRVENMKSNYWLSRFNGARRVLGEQNQNENLASTRLKQIY